MAGVSSKIIPTSAISFFVSATGSHKITHVRNPKEAERFLCGAICKLKAVGMFLNLSVSKEMQLHQLSSFLFIKQNSFFPVSGLL